MADAFHRDKDMDPQPKQSRLPLSGRVLSDAFAGRNKADRQGNVDVLRAFSEDSGFRNRSTQSQASSRLSKASAAGRNALNADWLREELGARADRGRFWTANP